VILIRVHTQSTSIDIGGSGPTSDGFYASDKEERGDLQEVSSGENDDF
jgi:hypothetical protein